MSNTTINFLFIAVLFTALLSSSSTTIFANPTKDITNYEIGVMAAAAAVHKEKESHLRRGATIEEEESHIHNNNSNDIDIDLISSSNTVRVLEEEKEAGEEAEAGKEAGGEDGSVEEAKDEGAEAGAEAGAEPAPEPEPVPRTCTSINEFVCDNNILSVFCGMLKRSASTIDGMFDKYDINDVVDLELDGNKTTTESTQMTLFAPTNDAFQTYADGLATLTADQRVRTLLFHFHEGESKMMWEDLICSDLLKMASTDLSRTFCRSTTGSIAKGQKGGGNRIYGDAAFVIDRNNMVCNGVVHIVDEVMLPNFITANEMFGEAYKNLSPESQDRLAVKAEAFFEIYKNEVIGLGGLNLDTGN